MTIESKTMAVISTSHIPEDEAEELTEAIRQDAIHGAMQRADGWLLRTKRHISDLPAISHILGYLDAKGFDWVLFDKDADPCPELTIDGH
ncbi:hypothetical protein [Halomonas sp. I5-271120]|uniref:DUF5983 family protein n=1 Tax=Halomonas sp. I5-271120 TaxID=3061632 RepID=UPI0027148F3D|nr:hypothetical protein [Halomonas sp. I5-271120]